MKRSLLLAGVALVAATATTFDRSYSQNEQLAAGTGAVAFMAAANALAKSASEAVELGRATARLDAIRHALTVNVLSADANEAFKIGALDETLILCNFRADQVAVASRRSYLLAVAAKIDEISKPSKIDDLTTAFQALVASHSLEVPGPANKAQLEEALKAIFKKCQSDVNSYSEIYYGKKFEPEAGAAKSGDLKILGLPGAIGSLIDAIVGIITPAVVEAAKIADEAKRRKAIQDYLTKPAVRAAIKEAGELLAVKVSEFVVAKRQRLTGAFMERLAALGDTKIDLTKSENCADLYRSKVAGRSSGAPKDSFILCWRAAWMQIETTAAAVVKAADDYDQMADVGAGSIKNDFDQLVKTLDAIPKDNFYSAQEFLKIVSRIAAFGEKVSVALSKESREKIHKAIDDLIKNT